MFIERYFSFVIVWCFGMIFIVCITKFENMKFFSDKTLYYIGKAGNERRLVLYTNEEKNKAFEECHVIAKTGEHCGKLACLKHLYGEIVILACTYYC